MSSQDMIFWNVDTQHDFMNKDGALYVEGAESIKPALARVTMIAREYGIVVVNTADWHTPSSEELSHNPDFVTTFPPHCLQYTQGATFIPETTPRSDAYVIDWRARSIDKEVMSNHLDVIIYKDSFDVFTGNPHTNDVVASLNPDKVVVYGVAENVCVDYAVRGLLERGRHVYVVQDAIKGIPGLPSPVDEWLSRGAELILTSSLEELLRREE